jgi:hypothetical protein
MAIGPSEISKTLLEEARHFEREIDKLLYEKALSVSAVNMTITPPNKMNENHFNILRQFYLDAGWKKVEWNDTQIGGKFIIFSI